MALQQQAWTRARDRLASALLALGYPEELADVLARQLGSPKAIDRMASYVRMARPTSMEMLADEMLAICADVDAWREKKSSQDAQARYNAWLYHRKSEQGDPEE